MARTTIAAQCLIRQFGNVRTAHDHRNPKRADRIGDAIGFRNHSSHGANPDESYVLITDVLCDLEFIHRLSVAVNEHHFMAGRCQSFEQEHPEVRHEVASHTVVRVVEQNSHR